MSPSLHTQRTRAAIAAAVLASVVPGVALGATSTSTQPDPRQLWNAYPLKPGQAQPHVRLPPGSASPPKTPVRVVKAADGGGGGASVPLLVGIGIAALALGAVAGRRLLRPREPAGAPSPGLGPPAVAAAMASPATVATPRRERPAPVAEPAEKPAPAAEPSRVVKPPAPRPAASVSPPPAAPVPRRASAPRPPAAPPLPPGDRFGRVPWPDGTEALWRCEITRHLGVVHSDFRAMAHQPGRRRAVEIARTDTHTRPGWGVEVPEEELEDTVRELASALRRAGWKSVPRGRHWFAARFVWPGPEAPALDLSDRISTTKERSDDR